MEFWGVEVKGGKSVKVAPALNEVIHLSQATLAELKNCINPVMLYAKVGDQKLVIGVLTADTIPQLSFDLVFEKEFELSHNWKKGVVHLTGYKSLMNDDDEDFSDDDELIPLEDKQNGVATSTAATKANPASPVAAAKKDDKAEDESDESDEEESEDCPDVSDSYVSDSDVSDKVKGNAEDDDDTTSKSEDSEEETPAKPAEGKKRPADTKTPEPKKAKLVTPQESGGKKAGAAHVDTPHPAKNAGKGDKSNVKTPKSAGQVTCGSCSRSFNSQNALDSHSKAKHSN